MSCVPRSENSVPGSVQFWRLAFFNHGVDSVIGLDPRLNLGLPITPASTRRDGTIVARRTSPAARYVVTNDRIEVAGRLVLHDRVTRLSLWEPSAPLRITNLPAGGSVGELLCPAAPS